MFEKIVTWVVVGLIGLWILIVLLQIIFISIIEGYRKRKWLLKKNTDLPVQTDGAAKNNKKSFMKKTMSCCYSGCVRYLIYKIGVLPSNKLRVFFYKHILHMNIGKKVIIHFRAEIRDGFKITIGDGSIIGDNCLLDGRSGITIGKNVNFSSNASVYTLEHNKNDPLFGQKGGRVIIGDRAWISANTIILPNISIGEGTLVCGGAVVTKSITSFAIVGGVPAKEIGTRNNNLKYEFDGICEWFI